MPNSNLNKAVSIATWKMKQKKICIIFQPIFSHAGFVHFLSTSHKPRSLPLLVHTMFSVLCFWVHFPRVFWLISSCWGTDSSLALLRINLSVAVAFFNSPSIVHSRNYFFLSPTSQAAQTVPIASTVIAKVVKGIAEHQTHLAMVGWGSKERCHCYNRAVRGLKCTYGPVKCC